MDLRVIGVLLLIPLLDVMLLVVLATRLPVTAVVAIVVLTALVGMLLVRAEGRHTLQRLQEKLTQGEPPTDELVDGGLLLVSGALFLTPGIVTDLVALLFVLPPTRYPIRVVVKKYVVTPYIDAKTGGFATGNVYVGGFPDEDDARQQGETVDMDADEYRNVDLGDDDTPDSRDDRDDRSQPSDS
jgi:UPF0716 protein FxsA